MEIKTSRYLLSHGKQPSRVYWGWAFDFICVGSEVTEFAPSHMKLAEAKKWAKARALQIPGCYEIQVGT